MNAEIASPTPPHAPAKPSTSSDRSDPSFRLCRNEVGDMLMKGVRLMEVKKIFIAVPPLPKSADSTDHTFCDCVSESQRWITRYESAAGFAETAEAIFEAKGIAV